MSNWIPTNELRIVERKFKWISTEGDYEERTHPVIQQKWELNDPKFVYQSEWRDVTVVEEE